MIRMDDTTGWSHLLKLGASLELLPRHSVLQGVSSTLQRHLGVEAEKSEEKSDGR